MNFTASNRLRTLPVKIGGLILGDLHPVRIQTMTTTDTMDTAATVAQSIRCIEAGAELIRITAPSRNEAENLRTIKEQIRKAGYDTPIVADIHFTPNAAEIAARIVEKVRVNPGNYVDKKKFEQLEYTDAEYAEEIDRIRDRFTPLVQICKEYGTAMRIGTNHGSLSDRIMSRFGDTPLGMVESAMEFLRIARGESYHQIVLSMKASNPQVMVQAYRLLVKQMGEEFGESYPLHLGVTEAGDGEDGRIKSAIGICTLMEEGLGDTIRVSLTEDPEFEIPVCRDMVKRYERIAGLSGSGELIAAPAASYKKRITRPVRNIGGAHVPVVIADLMHEQEITRESLESIGYSYDAELDKWHIGDAAADFVYTGKTLPLFELPGTLGVICDQAVYRGQEGCFPLINAGEYETARRSGTLNFIAVNIAKETISANIANDPTAVLCVFADTPQPLVTVRNSFAQLKSDIPVIIAVESHDRTADEQLIHFSAEAGALLLDGMGDGLWLMHDPRNLDDARISGRNYVPMTDPLQFLNTTAFGILQATRTRISKTEYISCPSCGRTLFDLQETTARIRNVTSHLKGVKIAIMGCIVNGPGEMADADFGYVGSGPGKITLYRGKDVVRRNVDSALAVDALIDLLKENGAWTETAAKVYAD